MSEAATIGYVRSFQKVRVLLRATVAGLFLGACQQLLGIEDVQVLGAHDGGVIYDGSTLDALVVDSGRTDADLSSPACVLRTSAVAWWRGEDNTEDSIGVHAGALIEGTNYGAGKAKQAFHFDGIDDYIEIVDDSEAFLPNASFSVELWMKSAGTEQNEVLIAKDECGGIDCIGVRSWWSLSLSSQRILRFWINNHTTTAGFAIQATKNDPGFGDSTYHHVVGVRDVDAARIHLYVDGSKTTGNLGGNSIFSLPMENNDGEHDPVTIAKPTSFSGGSSTYFKGQIDEVLYYNRALTEAEVDILHQYECIY